MLSSGLQGDGSTKEWHASGGTIRRFSRIAPRFPIWQTLSANSTGEAMWRQWPDSFASCGRSTLGSLGLRRNQRACRARSWVWQGWHPRSVRHHNSARMCREPTYSASTERRTSSLAQGSSPVLGIPGFLAFESTNTSSTGSLAFRSGLIVSGGGFHLGNPPFNSLSCW